MILTGDIYSIELPDDLTWTDQFWSATSESMFRTLEGGLIIKRGLRAGRPITLTSPSNNIGVITYQTLTDLQALADLHLDALAFHGFGQTLAVSFRYDNGNPVDGRPIFGYSRQQSDELWTVTINLREV